ncbi:MAG: winged helix-turn-helix domain-containing protein [Chloroflexi bacterium]|nr:winged helix-turn-helix domain-containing protein [Chloroflexota bacterium]
MTPTEYRLLCALAHRPATVLMRDELAGELAGVVSRGSGRPSGQSVDVHLRRLRGKLRQSAAEPAHAPRIVALWGLGYTLVAGAEA